ncbi:MAG: hypothetical protein KF734_20465 [Saprospiraceae bacterium]|nr:hypothetical protein [Saprospiraceae bacterium]
MGSPLSKYFRAIRLTVANIVHSPQLYFRRPGRDFCRRRLLPAGRTVWLVLSLLRLSLCVELGHFFQRLDAVDDIPTKSALVQARNKIHHTFFRDLPRQSAELFYSQRKSAPSASLGCVGSPKIVRFKSRENY